MTLRITAQELFDRHREKLALRWLAGQRGGARVLESVDTVARRPSLCGYLNIIYPNKVQILGTEELSWLDGLDSRARWDVLEKMMDVRPLALVVSKDQRVPEDMRIMAEETDTPVWASPRRGETHSGVSVSSAAMRRSSGTRWSLLTASASGRASMIFSITSQRARESRPSSQASSSVPRICTLLG